MLSILKYITILTVTLGSVVIEGQRRSDSNRIDTQYGSSLFRQNRALEGVPALLTLHNLTSVSHCLIVCLKYRDECRALNWAQMGGRCELLSDSLCANETLELTPKLGSAYYDVMDGPEFERKHLNDNYCRQFGKCSGRCYPRKPHYVDTTMTWLEARQHCLQLGRSLPQPRSLDEQSFYTKFIITLLQTQPNIRNDKYMRYWFGLTDRDVEGQWIYDDSTQVSDSFSAWSLGQPDNGGQFGKSTEDCGAINERGDWKWVDVSCSLKLKFFCA